MSRPTNLSVRGIVARAQREGRTTEVRLGGGLELRAGKTRASFSLKFVDGRTGRQERIKLGVYPQMSLAEAHRRAMEERARITDPRELANPARDRREKSTAATFRKLAEMRLAAAGRHALAPSTLAHYRQCLECECFPAMGDFPACEVRQSDVASIVEAVASRGSLVHADRVPAVASSVFAFGIGRGLVRVNPSAGIAPRSTSFPRDRVLTDTELGLVLHSIYCSGVSAQMRLILQLIVHTGQRSTEAREADASELHWDGVEVRGMRFSRPTWVLPGSRRVKGAAVGGRTKNRRDHYLPMSPVVQALFREGAGRQCERQAVLGVVEARGATGVQENLREGGRGGLRDSRSSALHVVGFGGKGRDGGGGLATPEPLAARNYPPRVRSFEASEAHA